MKKLFAILAFGLFLLTVPAGNAFAVEEAGQAATLAYRTNVNSDIDERVTRLEGFLASYNSPLADEARTFVEEADRNNLDWKLVAAIAGVESTFGKEIPTGSYNGWGWGVFTGTQDGVHFKDWAEGIAQVSQGLRKNYIDRGADTLSDIGWIYAANGDSWSSHVRFFIEKIAAFVPSTPDQLVVSI